MLIRRMRGLSVIELMIGIGLLAIVLVLAFPNFTGMLHNMKLRAASDSVLVGLQAARLEALKRNQTVEFLLTDSPIDAASPVANTTGPNWVVRAVLGGGNFDYVEGKSGLEGSAQDNPAALNVKIAGVDVPMTTDAPVRAAIQFDPLGRTNVTSPKGARINLSNPTAGQCRVDGGPVRCMRVVVTAGGRVRMCDPSVTAAGDTRACDTDD